MSNEIKHFGVLGMQWGRRKGRVVTSSVDHIRVASLKKKKLSQLSNDELKAFNTRRNLEKQYAALNPSAITKSKNLVKDTMAGLGWMVASAGTIVAAAKIGSAIYKKIKTLNIPMSAIV